MKKFLGFIKKNIRRGRIKRRNKKISNFLKANPEFINLPKEGLLKEFYISKKMNIEFWMNILMIVFTFVIAISKLFFLSISF